MPQQQYSQNYQPQIPQVNQMAMNSANQQKPLINNSAANANLKRKKKEPTPTNGGMVPLPNNPLQQQQGPLKKKQKQ